MLSAEANDRLTRVGPGTPMGNLLRRYWYPVAVSSEVEAGRPPLRRRLLGEDLAIFRLPDGTVASIQEACPHRRASLRYGIVEPEGIRCAYHGWLFDTSGQCLEQPAEAGSAFKDKIKAAAYPAEELGGLVFIYMGPAPAPLLPRFDAFVWDNVWREIWVAKMPFSWLQPMENSVDPHHVEFLHGRYANYMRGLSGAPTASLYTRRNIKVAFDEFEYGIIKRRIVEGETEEGDDWKVGHPLVFPHMLRVGFAWRHQFQIRVPVDDVNILHIWYNVYKPPSEDYEMPEQAEIPVTEIPLVDANGDFITDFIDGQDAMVWATQGRIADRSIEHLGSTDVGVIMLRKMLQREMAKVEDGLDPIGVVRDEGLNEIITLPQEASHKLGASNSDFWRATFNSGTFRYSPIRDDVQRLFEDFQRVEEKLAAG